MLLSLSNSPHIIRPLVSPCIKFWFIKQNRFELHIYFSYSYSHIRACTTFYLCKPPDRETYRSPVCRCRWWLLQLCVNSLYCAAAVRECRESMGGAHTHPQLQARTDSQPLCSSAGQPTQSSVKPHSATPTPARYTVSPSCSSEPSIAPPASFQLTFAILRLKNTVCMGHLLCGCVSVICSQSCSAVIPVLSWQVLLSIWHKHDCTVDGFTETNQWHF